MKNLKGTLILLLTAFIWGTAFVAQTSASGTISAFTFTGSRSVLATVFLFLFILLREAFERRKGVTETQDGNASAINRTPIWNKKVVMGGIFCGIPLCIASNLQQYGIELYPADTAASGRAGFLTATYVIIVALYTLVKEKKMRIVILLATIICMGGMYFLCLSGGLGTLYLGDVLILLCAIGFAVYIIVVDKYGTVDTIKVSCVQFAVVAVLSLICAFIFEQPNWSAVMEAALPICYAGIFSSGVAYTLQMVGQKYAEPAVATIVMSLESVFAALSGWVILGERLKGRELVGCILVFAAVILAQFPERKAKA